MWSVFLGRDIYNLEVVYSHGRHKAFRALSDAYLNSLFDRRRKNMNLPSGLVFVDDFITAEEEKRLLEYIDEQEWFSVSKNGRRVQHYGYRYNYLRKRAKEETTPIPPL